MQLVTPFLAKPLRLGSDRISLTPASPTPEPPTTRKTPCLHRRMIDEVRDKDGKRTGQVRCLECQAVFPDPYLGKR